MKLILSSDEALNLFNSEKPTVPEVLSNASIKQIAKGFDITDIYRDKFDTANLNNFVIMLEVKNNGD